MPLSLICLIAIRISAIPDLSSPPKIVVPSVKMRPFSIVGLIPLPGTTVSE